MNSEQMKAALEAGRWAQNWQRKLAEAVSAGKIEVHSITDKAIEYTDTASGERRTAEHPLAKWSVLQRDIFKDIACGTGHVVVKALAGCGKTTTICEGLRYVPKGARAIVCAYNKTIERELVSRVPQGVDVATLHSLALKAVAKAWNAKADETDSWSREWLDALPKNAPRGAIAKIASLCKSMLVHDEAGIMRVAEQRGMWPETYGPREDKRIVAWIQDFMAYALRPHKLVGFDDMVYIAAKLNLVGVLYDIVFVDETQDMSASQLVVAQNHLRQGGRLVLVGDPNQAIYGFRGADSSGMERMRRELKARVLPLNTTYRCGKAIVAMAQSIVPEFQAAPSNPEGEVLYSNELEMAANVSGGDAILSRTNAPLVKTCLELIRAGKKARVRGKDIGKELAGLVRKSGASSIKDLLSFLEGWVKDAIEKLPKAETETDSARIEEAAQKIYDTAETVRALAEGVQSTAELQARIEDIFGDEVSAEVVLLSSVHKAKGLEWNKVFLLQWTLRNGGEEDNIRYVAITRAKSTLVLVRESAK